MNTQIVTVKNRAGLVVLASVSNGSVYPKQYSNLTQANKAAEKVGGAVRGRFPFQVIVPGAPTYEAVGPLPNAADLKLEANAQARKVQLEVLAVELDRVPVLSMERLGRIEGLAPLVRVLLKDLGLKGISVRVPKYSMASAVEVRLPEVSNLPADYIGADGVDYQNAPFSEMPDEVPAKIASKLYQEARAKVLAILNIAFPRCDDRSDYQSDYFDYKFSV